MEKYVQGITQDIEKILTGFASEDDLQKEITGEMLLNKNVREIPSLLEPLFFCASAVG